jgi:hypothetical protein
MGFLRSFFFASSPRIHAQDLAAIQGLLPKLPAGEVIEGAYRRSGGRQASFYFAQGIVVGAMGNLFASSLGHFIDRVGAWSGSDLAWAGVGILALAAMAAMAWGAARRYRQNSQAESLFLGELRRRGGMASDDTEDPDELLLTGPGKRRRT